MTSAAPSEVALEASGLECARRSDHEVGNGRKIRPVPAGLEFVAKTCRNALMPYVRKTLYGVSP